MSDIRHKILVIDSDPVVTDLLRSNLSTTFEVTVCDCAEDALDLPLAEYSLIVLDIDLKGDIDGIEFIMMLRRAQNTAAIPFIFCTGHDTEDDIVRGFDAGADDYILKPFSLREVVARIRSVMRRRGASVCQVAALPQHIIKIEEMEVDLDKQRVTVEGEEVSLSRTEFMLLAYLLKHANNPCSRADLQQHVWPGDDKVTDRAVDVNISRLRKKLGAYGAAVSSVPGIGYKIITRN